MGPKADELLLREIRLASGACDRSGVDYILVRNGSIPDRTAAIVSAEESPVPEILHSLRRLEAAGCQFAMMACNTAHHFLPELQAQTSLKLLNMIEIAGQYINQNFAHKKIALMATSGTLRAKIYDEFLPNLLLPEVAEQENLVHPTTLLVKERKYEQAQAKFCQAVEKMQQNGAEIIILGCTELSILREFLQEKFPQLIFVDPMQIAAEKVVEIYHQAEQTLQNGEASPNPLANEIAQMALSQQFIRQ